MTTFYVSHGSPMQALENTPTTDFLKEFSNLHMHERPKAIIAISGHWDTAVPSVTVASRNSTIHDFYGFPKEAYEVHTYMLRMNKLPCTFCLRRICVFFFCSLHFRRIYLLHTLVIVDGDDTQHV
jgi:hypothetical protein